MKLSKFILAAVAAACLASGCASTGAGGESDPYFRNSKYEKGLLEGQNTVIDFARLTDVTQDMNHADAYAFELVATTKYTAIRDAFAKLLKTRENKYLGKDRSERQHRMLVEYEDFCKSNRQEPLDQFFKYLGKLDVIDFVHAQAYVSTRPRRLRNEATAGRDFRYQTELNETTDLKVDVWRILDIAIYEAENLQAGRPVTAGILKWPSQPFSDPACHTWAMDTKRGPLYRSKKQCETIIAAIPSMLEFYSGEKFQAERKKEKDYHQHKYD